MFNPEYAISRAASDLAFARRVATGGLEVARERYNYNVARRVVSAIRRVGLPPLHYSISEDGGVYLFTLEPRFMSGYGPAMDFFCHKNDSLMTAVMGAAKFSLTGEKIEVVL